MIKVPWEEKVLNETRIHLLRQIEKSLDDNFP